MQVSNRLNWPTLRPVLFLACLAPTAYVAWAAVNRQLDVDPFRGATSETGRWALIFLCLTLGVTPLRRLTQWHAVIKSRRVLGLFAFFYGSLHFVLYVLFDRFAGLDF